MPVKKRRLWLCLCAAIVLMAGMWSAPAPGYGSPTTITFWHTMKGHRKEVFDELVKRFQKAHPDVVVQDTAIHSRDEKMGNDYNALYARLLEGLATQKSPDVAQVYENWTTQFIDIDAIIPVESFDRGPEPLTEKDKADFYPIFREANSYDGKMWTVPFNKSIYVLYYNRSIFQKAGLPLPGTWEELKETARKLTSRQGDEVSQYGLVYTPSVDIFGHWLYAYGGDFLLNDTAVFGDSRGIKDLEYWVQLTNSDRSALPSFNAVDDFMKGKAAMYVDSTARIGMLKRECPFAFGIAPVPQGTTRSYQFAGTNLAIFSSASQEKRLAAWKFVRFLTNSENTAFWAINTGYLPVRQSAAKSQVYMDYLKSNPDYGVGIKALEFAKVQPRSPAWESIRGFINDAVYEAISQTSTPSQAIEKATTYSNGLLKSMKGKN